MDYSQFYDKTDVNSIVEYTRQLEGKTFADVILEKVGGSQDEIILAYGNKARKGGLGNLLEEIYYGYKANSIQDADFEEVGVELKVTCYEVNKNGTIKVRFSNIPNMMKDEWGFNFWIMDKLFSEDEELIEEKIID